jgi:uncharacterized membrane protein
MAIEFRCTQCGKLLRTPEGTEGKQARCPECGAVQPIAAWAPASDSSAGPAAPAGDPFAAPAREPDFAADALPAAAAPRTAPDFCPTRIEFSEILGRTWRLYTGNLVAVVVASLASHLCSSVAGAIPFAISMPLLEDRNPLGIPFLLVAIAVVALVDTFFLLGLMRFMLTVARGETVNFGDLFSAGPIVVPGAIVVALLILGTAAGAVFCLVPGILFLLVFSQSPFMLVDRRTGIIESFRDSAAAMRGNLLTLFLLFLVTSIAVVMFTVFTCGLGAILAAPFMSLLFAVVYLGVTGQQTADDRAVRGGMTFQAPGMQAT